MLFPTKCCIFYVQINAQNKDLTFPQLKFFCNLTFPATICITRTKINITSLTKQKSHYSRAKHRDFHCLAITHSDFRGIDLPRIFYDCVFSDVMKGMQAKAITY